MEVVSKVNKKTFSSSKLFSFDLFSHSDLTIDVQSSTSTETKQSFKLVKYEAEQAQHVVFSEPIEIQLAFVTQIDLESATNRNKFLSTLLDLTEKCPSLSDLLNRLSDCLKETGTAIQQLIEVEKKENACSIATKALFKGLSDLLALLFKNDLFTFSEGLKSDNSEIQTCLIKLKEVYEQATTAEKNLIKPWNQVPFRSKRMVVLYEKKLMRRESLIDRCTQTIVKAFAKSKIVFDPSAATFFGLRYNEVEILFSTQKYKKNKLYGSEDPVLLGFKRENTVKNQFDSLRRSEIDTQLTESKTFSISEFF